MFRRTLAALIACAGLAALPAQAQAPAWPRGQVRMLVTYPPGGTSDFVARAIELQLPVARPGEAAPYVYTPRSVTKSPCATSQGRT